MGRAPSTGMTRYGPGRQGICRDVWRIYQKVAEIGMRNPSSGNVTVSIFCDEILGGSTDDRYREARRAASSTPERPDV
jgi:hypothetical protein